MNPIQWLRDNGYTPYSILGLQNYQNRPISYELLCKHYMAASEIYHPDKLNTNSLTQQEIDEAYLRFCSISIAFSILENLTTKLLYDQTGNYFDFEQQQQQYNQIQNPWLMYSQGIWRGAKNDLDSLTSISIPFNRPNTPYLHHNFGRDITSSLRENNRPEPFDITNRIKKPFPNVSDVPELNYQFFHRRNPAAQGTVAKFSISEKDDQHQKMQKLQQLYNIPNEYLQDESVIDENDHDDSSEELNQSFIDYDESEIDNSNIINGSYDEEEKEEYNDTNLDEFGERNISDNNSDDDSDEISYTSKFVPVDYEELARLTREKQFLRGRELVRKFDKVISANRHYQPPSEYEFAAIQNRLVKRQKKNQERAHMDFKRAKRIRTY